jgi:hypothetical protein
MLRRGKDVVIVDAADESETAIYKEALYNASLGLHELPSFCLYLLTANEKPRPSLGAVGEVLGL